MKRTARWRATARATGALPVAAILLLLGCGGYFPPTEGGGGGGAGGSGTLIQMLMTPQTIVLGLRGTAQFSVSGTTSTGSATTPSVTYAAIRGTINPNGFYSASSVAGVDTVTATTLGGLVGTPPCCMDTSVVTVTANPPTALQMVAQPGGATSNAAFTNQPVVEVVDALDRQLLQAGVQVTAAVASGNGSLGGTTTVTTDSNGRAVFTDLFIVGNGATTLQFTSPGLTPVTSASFNVAQ